MLNFRLKNHHFLRRPENLQAQLSFNLKLVQLRSIRFDRSEIDFCLLPASARASAPHVGVIRARALDTAGLNLDGPDVARAMAMAEIGEMLRDH